MGHGPMKSCCSSGALCQSATPTMLWPCLTILKTCCVNLQPATLDQVCSRGHSPSQEVCLAPLLLHHALTVRPVDPDEI